MTKTKKRTAQHVDETAMEFLRRVVHNLNMEPESLLDDLPSVQAILDFFDLWKIYGTDFAAGIVESIEDGADPAPFNNFIKKHNLPWNRQSSRIRK